MCGICQKERNLWYRYIQGWEFSEEELEESLKAAFGKSVEEIENMPSGPENEFRCLVCGTRFCKQPPGLN